MMMQKIWTCVVEQWEVIKKLRADRGINTLAVEKGRMEKGRAT